MGWGVGDEGEVGGRSQNSVVRIQKSELTSWVRHGEEEEEEITKH
jgi:hypothetical protein